MYFVYCIKSNINDKVYIGQTKNFKGRILDHKCKLRNRYHCNKLLQEDYEKYGESNFTFKVLDTCTTRLEAKKLETFYINKFGGKDSGYVYNMQDLVGYTDNKSKHIPSKGFLGHKHTQESKMKTSKTLKELYDKGLMPSPPKLFGERNGFYGKTHTDEVKQLISKAQLGKRKYSTDFIYKLKQEYNDGYTINDLHIKYNIKKSTLNVLINHTDLYFKYGLNKVWNHLKSND